MWHYGVTQSQHCNNASNYNDDNVIHASMWFDILSGLGFRGKIHDIWERNMTTRSEISIWEHIFPKVSSYKWRSDIKEVDILKFRVYIDYPNQCVLLFTIM